jgi:hypothetical protein
MTPLNKYSPKTWLQRSVALMLSLSLIGIGCGDQSSGSLGDGPSLNFCQGKPDNDGDGFCDELENQAGLDSNNEDTNLNGFNDGTEKNPSKTPSSTSGGSDDGWMLLVAVIALPKLVSAVTGYFEGDDDEEEEEEGEESSEGSATPNTLGTPPASSGSGSVQVVIGAGGADPVDLDAYNAQNAGVLAKQITTFPTASFTRFVKIDSSKSQCLNRKWMVVQKVSANFRTSSGTDDPFSVYSIFYTTLPEDPDSDGGLAFDMLPINCGGQAGCKLYTQDLMQIIAESQQGSAVAKAAMDAVDSAGTNNDSALKSCQYSGYFRRRPKHSDPTKVNLPVDPSFFNFVKSGSSNFLTVQSGSKTRLGIAGLPDGSGGVSYSTDFLLTYTDDPVGVNPLGSTGVFSRTWFPIGVHDDANLPWKGNWRPSPVPTS